ncbi:MAG: hypothetical protein R3E48_15375 [Burkholderiaceae bacterium]
MDIDKTRKAIQGAMTICFLAYALVLWFIYPVEEHVRPGVQVGPMVLGIGLLASHWIARSEQLSFKETFWSLGLPIGIGLFFLLQLVNFSYSNPYRGPVTVLSTKPVVGGQYWEVRLDTNGRKLRLNVYFDEASGGAPADIALRRGALGYYFGSWSR